MNGTDESGDRYEPRQIRFKVGHQTQLRDQFGKVGRVDICDISRGGFGAECANPVRIGNYVAFDLPNVGTVRAQVRWQLGRKFGASFHEPLNMHGLDLTVLSGAEARRFSTPLN